MRILFPFAAPASLKKGPRNVALACALATLALGTLQAAVPKPTAQNTLDQTATPTTLKTQHPHKRLAAKAPAQAVAAPIVPAAPAEPEAPHWPANAQPIPATVTWDSRGLLITAANSSLAQILQDVSTATGAKIDGFSTDQRIFGSYGPGQVSDILVQLLQGSGYNVLMIGEQGQGTPKQILLSSRNGSAAPTPNTPRANSDDDDADVEEPVLQPVLQAEPQRPNGLPTRTPQQLMQEMQQRQRQMGQRNFPGDAPPNPGNYTPNVPPANPNE